MVAPEAILIFAVKLLEPLNVVELTVTPPGFVVPVTNHCALAPFLNPLPLMVTFRFTVPWGAALGVVELTWICAIAETALRKLTAAANASRTNQQCLDFISAPQSSDFCLT